MLVVKKQKKAIKIYLINLINYLVILYKNTKISQAMQNTEQEERQSGIKLIVIFSWLFIYGLLNILGSSESTALNTNNPSTVALLYIGQLIGVVILFIAPSMLFALFWTNKRIHYLGVTTKPHYKTLLLGSLGILFALPLINWIAQLNEQLHLPDALSSIEQWMRTSEAKAMELTELFTKGTSVSGLLINLFVVALMAALSEELFFRGIIQKVLIECFKNKHVSIWIGAIIFSAFHMQFFGFFPRMLMGAFLGYLFLWSGSLWPGIVAHFVNNGTAVFLIWLSNRGVISSDADKIGIDNSQLIYVIISALIVSGSLYLIYHIEKKKKAAR